MVREFTSVRNDNLFVAKRKSIVSKQSDDSNQKPLTIAEPCRSMKLRCEASRPAKKPGV